jgi:zinc transporter 5/7
MLTSSPRRLPLFTQKKPKIKYIFKDKKTRRIAYFIILNYSFAFVELIYGLVANSLSLTSDSLHMFFDSSALVLAIVALFVSKMPPSNSFTYGYGRVETLAAFVITLLLVITASRILIEAVQRLFYPQDVDKENILWVSVLGLVVNLFGLVAFDSHSHHHHTHNHNHSHCRDHSHKHHHHNHNSLMHGMFLHVLADTLGSVGVIVSSFLIRNFGWTISDPICSIFISVTILASCMPLLKSSAFILLQRVPVGCESEVMTLRELVLSTCTDTNFLDPSNTWCLLCRKPTHLGTKRWKYIWFYSSTRES